MQNSSTKKVKYMQQKHTTAKEILRRYSEILLKITVGAKISYGIKNQSTKNGFLPPVSIFNMTCRNITLVLWSVLPATKKKEKTFEFRREQEGVHIQLPLLKRSDIYTLRVSRSYDVL
eukprot:GEMP01046340.1.p1 GENE.GEMP01046340.1~~GEMP01046340.1.p1  ORF type:complete len:118 (-),score=5.92 GEMP01046340.1:412-765(-)